MSVHHDMPTMQASNYANSTYGGAQMMGSAAFISNSTATQSSAPTSDQQALKALFQAHALAREAEAKNHKPATPEKEPAMSARRIVQVYIADPSEAVPLENSILYTGDQKMTDLTDQELFFEIDIKTLLEAHNAKRTAIIDKKVKDRTEYLEAAKVRDLKMVVVTVASF